MTNAYATGDLSIAICGRCKMKRKYLELRSDPNSPGLRVCIYGCIDEFDPYRLPARQPEAINLRFPRPDTSVATDPFGLPTEDDSYFMTTEDGEGYLLP